MKPLTFDNLLAEMRESALSEKDKGAKFEQLMCKALPLLDGYGDRFKRVVRWHNWELRAGSDAGIDLVAEIAEEYGGGYCAVQCKFYAENTYIQKENIDSFIAESGRAYTDKNDKPAHFKERLIVATSDRWSANAESGIRGHAPPVQRLGLQTLRDAAIDWRKTSRPARSDKKKTPHEYQRQAVKSVTDAFRGGTERGKMIMACGTGKTYTAMQIAEKYVGKGGSVLFLVPSISLLSQSLNDFVRDRKLHHRYAVVCSDSQAGNVAEEDFTVSDLLFPPTTRTADIARCLEKRPGGMTVIFSTYQSLDKVAEAQKSAKDSDFDLIICDEAHRTTGVERWVSKGAAESELREAHFTKVHKNAHIKGARRLYMTATPKIYAAGVKKTAEEYKAAVFSMDDEQTFGAELFRYSFSRAVQDGNLSDYHVHILCMKKEELIAAHDGIHIEKDISLEDAVKMAGCWKAMRRPPPDNMENPPMKRVVVFCKKIIESKTVQDAFPYCARQAAIAINPNKELDLILEAKHVDGTMNAMVRARKLGWLHEEPESGHCRILTNARCLTEGVDVPSLDGVAFFSPRKSQIDIVQAVGRVMRKSPGKKIGNIILPVVMPDDATPENILSSGNNAYKHVWQVLAALRAHDDRFQAEINKVEFNRKLPENITVDVGLGGGEGDGTESAPQEQMAFGFRLYEWTDAIIPRFVENCGDRMFWAKWVKNVADIAEIITKLIHQRLQDKNSDFYKEFAKFRGALHQNINGLITWEQAAQTLVQHIITKPVFDALFSGYAFSKQNAISRGMDGVVRILEKTGIAAETKPLENFYRDVASRAENIKTLEGRQNIMETLYSEFFRSAFKKEAEQAGIVYTPAPVVDFINRSADWLLRKEFGVGLTAKNVHILDPFTGTGRFIVRLLASDLIADKDLARKYENEIHINEKLLLPYYVANVNLEQTYHARKGGDYMPFQNGILCDTFQTTEKGGKDSFAFMRENKNRADAQSALPIRVILSNPPYSIGQRDANDDAQNPPRNYYAQLDGSIQETFRAKSSARSGKALYDSYVRAIRWSINRIPDDEGGIIGFVTNAGFLHRPSLDGLRKSLVNELSAIYILDLRGNQRTQGEMSLREGGKIFGGGSRTPVAIALLIKKPGNQKGCRPHYFDIGDYLTREQKLSFLEEKESAANIAWQKITPSPEGDWLNQRDPAFKTLSPIHDDEIKKAIAHAHKNKNGELSKRAVSSMPSAGVFAVHSLGAGTNRDIWAYNFSQNALGENMRMLIDNYNAETRRLIKEKKTSGKNIRNLPAFFTGDKSKIAWSKGLMEYAERGKISEFNDANIRLAHYRPFCAKYLYYDPMFTQSRYQTHWLFHPGEENPAICVSSSGASDWSPFGVSHLPDLNLLGAGAQCFPFYLYFRGKKQDNILDGALEKFRAQYKNKRISKMDIFHYIYAILHHPVYRERFRGNLLRELPRVPFAPDFRAFADIGAKLADLHINYESAPEYDLQQIHSVDEQQRDLGLESGDKKMPADLRVEKMRYGRDGRKADKSLVRYNESLSFELPDGVHEYKVNGKSPVEWVVDRYRVSEDKDSGIIQNPNDWADEQKNPAYILSLLKKAAHIGVASAKLIRALPADLGVD